MHSGGAAIDMCHIAFVHSLTGLTDVDNVFEVRVRATYMSQRLDIGQHRVMCLYI